MYGKIKGCKRRHKGGWRGVFLKRGEKALYILGVVHCACSDCPPVVLIFNGKWLRFLSKPLELRNKKRRERGKRG